MFVPTSLKELSYYSDNICAVREDYLVVAKGRTMELCL